MAENFSQKLVNKFSASTVPDGKSFIEWNDSVVKGLSLRRGKRTAVFYYTNPKKRKRIKIGSAADISLKDARNEAYKLAGDMPVAQDLEPISEGYGLISVRRYLNEVYYPNNPGDYKQRELTPQLDDVILNTPMMKLKSADIEDWVKRRTSSNVKQATFVKGREIELRLTNKTVKPETARRGYAALRSIYNWAVRRGHIEYNPIAGVKIKGEKTRLGRAMADYELNRYLDALEYPMNKRLKCFLLLLINTGARPREILTLKRVNIRGWLSERPSIVVDAAFSKTAKQREIPLNSGAVKGLNQYLGSEDDLLDSSKHETEWVFFSPSTKTHVKTMYKTYKAWQEKHGLPHHDLYAFRHTFAYNVHQKADLATTRDLMGHASITTTDIYLKGSQQNQRAAVDDMFDRNEAVRMVARKMNDQPYLDRLYGISKEERAEFGLIELQNESDHDGD